MSNNEVTYKNTGTVKVNTRLNVRTGPSRQYKIIGKLYDGNQIDIVAKNMSDTEYPLWYKFNYKGSTAYCCATYVKVVDGDDASNIPNINDETDQTNQDHYMLVGSARVKPNFNIKVRDVINAQGLGKYLSGAYYIEEVEFEVNDTGLVQSATLSKNAFGESLKHPNPNQGGTGGSNPNQPNQVKPPTNERKHTFRPGDTLWGLARQYYGSGSKWPHIAKANGIDVNDDRRIRTIQTGEVFIIPYL